MIVWKPHKIRVLAFRIPAMPPNMPLKLKLTIPSRNFCRMNITMPNLQYEPEKSCISDIMTVIIAFAATSMD